MANNNGDPEKAAVVVKDSRVRNKRPQVSWGPCGSNPCKRSLGPTPRELRDEMERRQPALPRAHLTRCMQKSIYDSLTKALLAGLAGGLAGSLAKLVGEKIFPPRTEGQTPPPRVVVDRAQAAAGASMPPVAKKSATQGIHWVFGTVAGGVYGIAAEYQPKVTAWHGAAFGLTVNRIMHKGMMPQTGLVEPVEEQPLQEKMSEWVTHVAYGFVAESVRRGVRKRL